MMMEFEVRRLRFLKSNRVDKVNSRLGNQCFNDDLARALPLEPHQNFQVSSGNFSLTTFTRFIYFSLLSQLLSSIPRCTSQLAADVTL